MRIYSTDEDGYTAYYTDEQKNYFWENEILRDDPSLVKTVEELGYAANGKFAQLEVVEIPDGISWEILNHDGQEWIAEEHRTW